MCKGEQIEGFGVEWENGNESVNIIVLFPAQISGFLNVINMNLI